MAASIKLIDLQTGNEVDGTTSAEIEINTLRQDKFLLDIEYTKGDESDCKISILQGIDDTQKQVKILSENGNLEEISLDYGASESSLTLIPILNTIGTFKLSASLNGASSDNGGTLIVKIKPNLFKNFV